MKKANIEQLLKEGWVLYKSNLPRNEFFDELSDSLGNYVEWFEKTEKCLLTYTLMINM